MSRRRITPISLGRVEYEDGLALQALFGKARAQGLVEDTLLLLEHPPVITLGRAAKPENVILPVEQRERLGVEVVETNRGGDVTYHGPGQIVGYPIFDLAPDRKDVRKYVRSVEEVILRALAQFGISAGRIPKWTGVWIGEEDSPDARKIAAIGVHLSRWLTSHGFALNVNTDLTHFGWIIPCGIREAGVTSMAQELGSPLPIAEVEDALSRAFGEVFEAELAPAPRAMETISVSVVRTNHGEPEVLLLQRTPERGGFWQTVTGRVEANESPAQAARRELAEETGTTLEVLPLDYAHSFALGEELPPRLVHETAFWARWPEGQEVRTGPEHQDHAWLPLGEALARLPFRGLKEGARRAVAASFGG
jgi:lipoyl(octanoyl) transferase